MRKQKRRKKTLCSIFTAGPLRCESSTKTLVYGSFEPVCRERKDFFGYVRRDEEGTFYVELNLSCGELKRPVERAERFCWEAMEIFRKRCGLMRQTCTVWIDTYPSKSFQKFY